MEGDDLIIAVEARQLFGRPLEARPMQSDKSFPGRGRPWVPPTVTKLAIGTQTKSPVAADQGIAPGLEPRPAATPAMKFGFSIEWSFPLSARTD
jgi:hypothetical protein